MNIDITKEWFERHAALEGDLEIGAGRRFPPAYNNCTCGCHRSPMMHIVPCCHPTDVDVRRYLGVETTQDIVDEVSRNFAADLERIFGSATQKEAVMTTDIIVRTNGSYVAMIKIDGEDKGTVGPSKITSAGSGGPESKQFFIPHGGIHTVEIEERAATAEEIEAARVDNV